MSVILDVKGTHAYVPYEAAMESKFIRQELKTMGHNYIIPVPDDFYAVIGNYINFLNGNGPAQIKTVAKLSKCFDMENYFIDDNYFNYLMQTVFDDWTTLSPAIYDEPNRDIQYNMFLHFPYEFIPIEYTSNDNFMKLWSDIPQNQNIQFNDDFETITYSATMSYYDDGNLQYILVMPAYYDNIDEHDGYSVSMKFYPRDGHRSRQYSLYYGVITNGDDEQDNEEVKGVREGVEV